MWQIPQNEKLISYSYSMKRMEYIHLIDLLITHTCSSQQGAKDYLSTHSYIVVVTPKGASHFQMFWSKNNSFWSYYNFF